MTTNLPQRFIEASSKYEMSEEAHDAMVNHAEGLGGAELIYKYYRRFILAFIKAELLSLAEEVDNLPITSGSVANAAAIIRNRANEI